MTTPILTTSSPLSPKTPPHLHPRADKTLTITETITIEKFYVSYATTPSIIDLPPLTLTDTIFINRTIFSHITHTATSKITVHQNVDRPVTVTMTSTSNSCPKAQATLEAEPFKDLEEGGGGGGGGMSPAAIGLVVLGVVLGLAVLAGAGWFGVRKWRARKAQQSQRMRGVELQREWEREQEMRWESGPEGGKDAVALGTVRGGASV